MGDGETDGHLTRIRNVEAIALTDTRPDLESYAINTAKRERSGLKTDFACQIISGDPDRCT